MLSDIRYILLDAALICQLFALYQLVRILVEYYSEEKESRRQTNQSPSEPDKRPGLTLHLIRIWIHRIVSVFRIRPQAFRCRIEIFKLRCFENIFKLLYLLGSAHRCFLICFLRCLLVIFERLDLCFNRFCNWSCAVHKRVGI